MHPSIPTFAQAAAKVIELRRPTWSNAKHAAQWESTASHIRPPRESGARRLTPLPPPMSWMH